MKYFIIVILMVGFIFLTKTSYALPRFTKQCSECKGRGYSVGFFGGRIPCENCGGDGETFNWWWGAFIPLFFAVKYFNGDSKK